MPDVVDIIHNLTIDVDSTKLEKSLKAVEKNITEIERLRAQILKFQEAQAKVTGQTANDIRMRENYGRAIDKNTKLLEAEISVLNERIAKDKVLEEAIKRETSMLANLTGKLNDLKKARDASQSKAEYDSFSKSIKAAEKDLTTFIGKVEKGEGALGTIRKGILQGVGIGGGIQLVSGGINAIKDMVAEASRLAAEMEGVLPAFERLNQPGLLDKLREATKGTISDLELMKRAIQFDQFGLRVDKLGEVMKFARIRARETGQDIDYVLGSLTDGIARQSVRLLDNLGFNQKRVREEFKKTGDFATAVFNIMGEDAKKAGDDYESYAERMKKINADIENSLVRLGGTINNLKSGGAVIIQDIFDAFSGRGDLLFTGPEGNAWDRYQKALADQEQAKENNILANKRADAVYLNDFKKYVADYTNADLVGRQKIEAQAQSTYDFLKNVSADWIKSAGMDAKVYQEGLRRAFAKIQEDFKGAKGLNIFETSTSQFSELSKQSLDGLKKQVAEARDQLSAGDTKQLGILNVLDKALDENLAKISGKVDKAADKAAVSAAHKAESLADKRLKYNEDLNKKIAALTEQELEIRLKAEVETYAKIDDLTDAKLKKDLEQIASDKKVAESRKLLTAESIKLFDEIEKRTRTIAELNRSGKKQSLFDTQAAADVDANIANLKAQIEARNKAIGLGLVESEKELREALDRERKLALAEERRDAVNQFNAAVKNGTDTKEVLKRHNEEVELINLDFTQRQLKIYLDYYEQLAKIAAAGLAEVTQEIDKSLAEEEINIYSGKGSFSSKQKAARLAGIKATVKSDAEATAAAKAELSRDYAALYATVDQPDGPGKDKAIEAARAKVAASTVKLAEATKKQADGEKELSDFRNENFKKQLDFYSELSFAAVSAYNMIADAAQAATDREIQIREYRVTQATRLAERGNVEILRIEQKRLNEAIRQREEAARRQIAINQALAVSEAIVALAQSLGGDPYTVVARVIALLATAAAGYTAITNSTNNAIPEGFYTGGYTGEGDPKQTAGAVHKKEFVMDAENTKKYRSTLEAMHAGTYSAPPTVSGDIGSADRNTYATKADFKMLAKEIGGVREAVESSKVNVRQSVDAAGVNQIVETEKRRDRRRFA